MFVIIPYMYMYGISTKGAVIANSKKGDLNILGHIITKDGLEHFYTQYRVKARETEKSLRNIDGRSGFERDGRKKHKVIKIYKVQGIIENLDRQRPEEEV